MCEQILKKQLEELRRPIDVEIYLNTIQLLIRQNVPPLI